MKRILISVAIGIVVTILLGLVAGFAGAACHCSTPLKILFPFTALLERASESEAVEFLFVLQFPAYAAILALTSLRLGGTWTAFAILLLLGVHFVAALMAAQ